MPSSRMRLSSSRSRNSTLELYANCTREEIIGIRLKTVLLYFGLSIILTGLLAFAILNDANVFPILMLEDVGKIPAIIFAIVCSHFLVFFTQYREGCGMKQVAWLLFLGANSVLVANFVYDNGVDIASNGGFYTIGIVAILCAVLIYAPIDMFVGIREHLDVLFLIWFTAMISEYFWSHPILQYIYGYGSILFYALKILYDVQNAIYLSKMTRVPFDPVVCALQVYLDMLLLCSIVSNFMRTSPRLSKLRPDGYTTKYTLNIFF